MNIERLEARIAPATLNLAGTVVTFTDIDGDAVKLTFTHAVVSKNKFIFTGGFDGTGPQSLTTLDLEALPGVNLVATATPQKSINSVLKGDSHVNIDTINGQSTDLGTISIDGNVNSLSAGTLNGTGPGLKSFTALSMGAGIYGGFVNTELHRIGSFTIKGDVTNEVLNFTGGVKTLTIGGNFAGRVGLLARLQIVGGVGALAIGGSILAEGGGSVASLSITGSETPGTIKIGGSVVGGITDPSHPFQILVDQPLKSFTVGHDVRGGSGDGGGAIHLAAVGTLKIGGSLLGHDDASTNGFLYAGSIGSLTIGGDLRGGNLTGGANVRSNGNVTVVGNVGSFKLGGDFAAGADTGNGAYVNSNRITIAGTMGALTVGGSIFGRGTDVVSILVAGTGIGAVNALKSLSVKGGVERASIVTGYYSDVAGFSSGNKDSGIGSIVIGGSLTGSQVDVGTSSGSDGIPGTEDDYTRSTIATLGSVKIGGAFNGLSGSTTNYYIYGPHVKKLTVGKATYTEAALHNNVIFDAIGRAVAISVS